MLIQRIALSNKLGYVFGNVYTSHTTCFNLWLLAIHYEYLMIFLVSELGGCLSVASFSHISNTHTHIVVSRNPLVQNQQRNFLSFQKKNSHMHTDYISSLIFSSFSRLFSHVIWAKNYRKHVTLLSWCCASSSIELLVVMTFRWSSKCAKRNCK